MIIESTKGNDGTWNHKHAEGYLDGQPFEVVFDAETGQATVGEAIGRFLTSINTASEIPASVEATGESTPAESLPETLNDPEVEAEEEVAEATPGPDGETSSDSDETDAEVTDEDAEDDSSSSEPEDDSSEDVSASGSTKKTKKRW